MKPTKAFTLIEILIVVAIVGILSGIVVVSMSDSQEKARIAKIKGFSDSLRSSMLTSLVSEWKLDGDATDSWGSNNGTASGGPEYKSGSECVSGGCLSFDGTDDYVNCGTDSSLDITNEITIEAWINPMGQSGAVEYILSKNSAYYIRYLDTYNFNGTVYIAGSPRSIVSSDSLQTNSFSHVLLTYDGENIRAYINGEEETPVPQTGLIDSNTNAVHIGGPGADGTIDTVRIYNQALTSSAIQQNYLAGLDSLLTNQSITQQEYDNRVSNLNNYAQQY